MLGSLLGYGQKQETPPTSVSAAQPKQEAKPTSASAVQPKKEPPLQLPAQLIQNGSMEQNPAKTWGFGFFKNQNNNPNGYTYGQSFEAAASGEHSLKINCNFVKNDTAHCFIYQSIPAGNIPAGSKLTLKGKIKAVNLDGKGVALAIRGDKTVNGQGLVAGFITTEGRTLITGTHEFEDYTLTIDSYPGNMDYIVVMLFYLPGTTGTVYLDDVTLAVN